MRILHIADLHYRRSWLDWVLSHCAEFDALVVAGDLLDAFAPTPSEVQVAETSDWLLQLRVPTIVCSGNHDDLGSTAWSQPDEVARAEWLRKLRGRGNILAVDGDTVEIDGVAIAVNGWGSLPNVLQGSDVFVTHAPPSECYCAGSNGQDFGDPRLYKSPGVPCPFAWILCGHIHEPRRPWCRWPSPDSASVVLVPGVEDRSDVPAHWLIDTRRGVAVHSSSTIAQL